MAAPSSPIRASRQPPIPPDVRETPNAEPSAESFQRLLLALHRDLDVRQVGLAAVNEGRSLLGCDRLALAVRRGRRAELLAVSGQEQIVTRSNLVRAMADLATALGDADKPLRLVGPGYQLPPPLRESVLQYVNISGAQSLEAVPLRRQLPVEGDRQDHPRLETIGWLISEDFQPRSIEGGRTEAQAFFDHVAVALDNARQLERAETPLRRLARLLYAPSEVRSARQASLAAGALIAAAVVLGMLPVRYRVEAPGRLLPVRRSELFAPSEGRVTEVFVDSNQSVAKGQVLLRLDNERLASELLVTRHELEEKQKLLATLEAQNGEIKRSSDPAESIRISGAISQTKIEIAGALGRLKSLEQETSELEVRSPRDGTVTTFEPSRQLLNRPVERGQPLLEVMDVEGPWELRLDLPAKRVGQVLAAQADGGPPAPVQFTLATEPDAVHNGALRTISSRIVAGADGQSVAPLEVNVAVSDIAHPVAGADVIARVDCGKRAFARVVFGDVVDFFRSRLW